MKKVLYVLGIIGSALIAFLTANRGLIKQKNEKLKQLEGEKKDLELKAAVLIDNARDAKKKTIKSEKELEREIKKVSDAYGDSVDDLVEFIATGKRKAAHSPRS